jgi:pimeloyl-ACP methyl ester carboxylesterase
VEYIDAGHGRAILVSHGVLGGHDNIRDLVDLWVGPDNRAVGPSRFGYLGSAMPPDATPADQADAFAAVLDHLGLDRVVALGFSAGGPAAIQLALRHPHRLHGLMLGSSYLPGMARPTPRLLHPIIRAAVGWERGWWLLKSFRPSLLARIMGVPKGWDPSGDADFLAIRDALFPIHPNGPASPSTPWYPNRPPTGSRWRTSEYRPCSSTPPTTASPPTSMWPPPSPESPGLT